MKKVATNFFYQAILQVTKIIIPIVTVPIVSNAIGPQGIGIYNFTNSISLYFVLIASLGIFTYGNRAIAMAHSKNEDISKLFWEIVTFKAIFTLIVLAVYFIMINFMNNRIYFLMQSLPIISVLFDISWLFMGVEDFRKTSLCNLFSSVFSFLLIILFVKNGNDIGKYIMIQSIGMLFPQLLTWTFVRKYIHFKKISFVGIFQHGRESLQFFIPQAANILYTNLNKTLLGVFIGTTFVGYYTNSLVINDVFVSVITTLDIVLLPHMSGLFAKKDTKKMIEIMKRTIHLQLFFLSQLCLES